MKLKDYEDYQKNNVKASKSQIKDYIQVYADMVKKLKNEDAIELKPVKENIKKAFKDEIYFTLIDEKDEWVKLIIKEPHPNYIIPVFTDIREYAVGSAEISKLFLDKLEMKVITSEDLLQMGEDDKDFEGFVINPHSQNFNMDKNGCF